MIHGGPATVLVIVISSEGLEISGTLKCQLNPETEVAGEGEDTRLVPEMGVGEVDTGAADYSRAA